MNSDKKLIIITVVIPIAFILAGFYLFSNFSLDFTTNDSDRKLSAQNSSNSIVPIDQIVSGGPPPDGIPSIDNPKFISIEQADSFLSDDDLVLGVSLNGETRAYPLQILVWHEIVNDVVGGTPVAVTYCPLCFTNQVFNRTTAEGEILEFGTSGKLYNSNLVMYDRNTSSLWSQAMAQSITGEYSGTNLERIPFDLTYWSNWKQLYPESLVLSQDTGHVRPYGVDPYGDYYTNPDVLFPVSNQDDRLALKDIIVGVNHNSEYKAYPLRDIESLKVINDRISGKDITIWSVAPFFVKMFDPSANGEDLTFSYDSMSKTFFDDQTGSEWNLDGESINGPLEGSALVRLAFDEGFWFEWVAFHPETDVFKE